MCSSCTRGDNHGSLLFFKLMGIFQNQTIKEHNSGHRPPTPNVEPLHSFFAKLYNLYFQTFNRILLNNYKIVGPLYYASADPPLGETLLVGRNIDLGGETRDHYIVPPQVYATVQTYYKETKWFGTK